MPRRSRRAAVVASNESSTPNTSQQPLNTPQSTTQLSRSKGTDDSVVDTVQNQPDSSTATILAVIPAARSTSSDKQHKSVVFAAEEGTGQQADSSLQSSLTTASKSTRSRRSSTATNSNTSQSSSKALGKRRAISPLPAPEPDSEPVKSTDSSKFEPSTSNKRRKTAHKSSSDLTKTASVSTTSDSSSRSLRSRSGKGKDKQLATAPAQPQEKPTETMPRKGSRAQRAARAKARAYEDEIDGDDFDLDRYEDDEVRDFDMAEPQPSSSTSSGRKKHVVGAASTATSATSPRAECKDFEQPASTTGKTNTAGDLPMLIETEGGGDHEDHPPDESDGGGRELDDSEGHDEDDDNDVDEDDDEIDEEDDDDDDDDDGMYDGYDSHGSDMIDPPQTFDEEGSPVHSDSSLLDRGARHGEGLNEESAAAEAAALFGSGGAFRALQELMSGMSGRLKGLLASLKDKSSGPSANLIALQDLAELLSVSTEDTLAGYFQTEAFTKELVSILRGDSNTAESAPGGGADGAMTIDEMIAFGMDPDEIVMASATGSGGGSEENNVQMMLLACRCLANLMEALPGSAHSVVYAGAVPVLCSKLQEIQYIDLAEQTLSTLEKISEEVPSAIVRGGGLSALLNFIDFFSFHVQRTAVTAAANCCRSLSLDSFTLVQEVMPIFKNILGYPDQRVVEQGCLAIVRIVDSYRHFPDKLEALLSADMLSAVRALLNPDSTTVGPGTYTQTLKMLSTASKASPGVSIMLVELNIANTLYHLLTGVPAPDFADDKGLQVLPKAETGNDDMLVMQNLVQRPKEQVQETLNIVCELLPALPKTGLFDQYAYSSKSRAARTIKVKREEDAPLDMSSSSATASHLAAIDKNEDAAPASASDDLLKVKTEPTDTPLLPASTNTFARPSSSRAGSSSRSGKSRETKEALIDKRVQLLRDASPERRLVINRFYALMLPILVDICTASVSPQVRTKAVLGLLKIVNYCDVEELTEILHTVSMASFLAAMLSSRDQTSLVTSALQLVELLLVKMPDAYQYHFRREGVMHEIEQIAAIPLRSPKSKPQSPARTPEENPAGSSSRDASLLSKALQHQAAVEMAAGTSIAGLSSSEVQALDMLTLRARHLRDTYSSEDSEPALRARSALDAIVHLVKQLEALSEDTTNQNVDEAGKEARDTLKAVAALFSDERNPLSGFELLESGLIDGLLRFTTDTTASLPVQLREELFAEVFLPLQADGSSSSSAFGLLVKRLQESLSRMEQFEVEIAAQTAFDSGDRQNGPSMLARQLKLRLVAEEGFDIPRSCTNIVVSIHAIATLQAFNDYLRPRILAATSLAGGSASGSRLSSFLAAFAAANAASPPPESSSSAAATTSALARGLERQAGGSGTGTRAGPSSVAATGVAAAASSSQQASGSANMSGEGPSTNASGTTGQDAAGSAARQAPSRRRSRRLSGQGVETEPDGANNDAAAPADQEAKEPVPADATHEGVAASDAPIRDNHDEQEHDHMPMDDEEIWEEEDELFSGAFEAPVPSRDERPVNLEVAGDGVVAKTPDGTRISTPTIAGATAGAGPSSARPTAPKPRASYAAAVKSEPTDFHLEFTIGGQDVDLDTTVYGAVHKHNLTLPENQRHNMWHQIHEIRFKKVPGPARSTSKAADSTTSLSASRPRRSLLTDMPASIPAGSQQTKILQLLWVLQRLNAEYIDRPGSEGLSETAFVNNKLTAKLNRQLEEPMIVASACLPAWAIDLPVNFPFLFPFETRYTFLQSTAFGYARLMQKWVGQARTDNSRRDDNLGFLGRLQRQKVRISRDRMLESAFKVFELYGSSRASLEVEFFAEVGSGLGPTLEFYALVSKEFARKDLNVWRHSESGDASFVHSALGLFPAPAVDFSAEAGQRKLKIFRVMGQFVAKSMMDTRIIDVHFSRTFMRLVLEQDVPLTISSVKLVDGNLGSSLAHLQSLLDKSRKLEVDDFKTDDERAHGIAELTAAVEDMTLDFTLPGYDIELKPGGSDLGVTIVNLEEYISLVIEWTMRKGVQTQLQEFKDGFSSVFPVRDLQSFTPAELVMMTGAIQEDWSVECLTNATKADHGFTMDSRPVRDLISIMSEFTPAERREFLSFTTGSPRLPIGGFSALSPALTIVRKDGGDGSLFSTMTCANFLKLPNYSSREIVKERVLFAIKEGQGGFHLS